MTDNAQKTPFALSLNRLAQRKVLDTIAQLGQALPCTAVSVEGQIVTVSFAVNAAPWTLPQVEMPIATWLYDWIPVEAGKTQGLTFPSSVYLGGISGLGGGTADLSRPANLSALMFVPVANSAWSPPGGDALKRVVQGPNGVLVMDLGGNATLTVDNEGNAVLHGLKSFSTDVNGYGSRTTYLGGNAFQVDNYTQGATVTTVNHAWAPSELPSP